MTIYGLIFRYLGWLIGPLTMAGIWTSWLGGTPTAWSRLLGLAITLLWLSRLLREALPKVSIALFVCVLLSGGVAGFAALSESRSSANYAAYTEATGEVSEAHTPDTLTYRLAVARSLMFSDPLNAISLYTDLLRDDPLTHV